MFFACVAASIVKLFCTVYYSFVDFAFYFANLLLI